jgi:hypothetical protein
MTLIPELELQLTHAATIRHRRARRRAIRVVAATGAAASLVVLWLVVGRDPGRPVETHPPSGASQGHTAPDRRELPGGEDPRLEDILGVFRRDQNPHDRSGHSVSDLEKTGDRQPGEDPSRSRRIDLPGGPVFLWPRKDGVCASWGNCVSTKLLRGLGVAESVGYSTPLHAGAEASTLTSLHGIAVDGIATIRLEAPGGDIVLPVKDNVFRASRTALRSKPTAFSFDYAGQTVRRPLVNPPALDPSGP